MTFFLIASSASSISIVTSTSITMADSLRLPWPDFSHPHPCYHQATQSGFLEISYMVALRISGDLVGDLQRISASSASSPSSSSPSSSRRQWQSRDAPGRFFRGIWVITMSPRRMGYWRRWCWGSGRGKCPSSDDMLLMLHALPFSQWDWWGEFGLLNMFIQLILFFFFLRWYSCHHGLTVKSVYASLLTCLVIFSI